ncbi:hypothetical protein CKA32_005883 [Geitlerinema sp. FC II]|nr:hypothetical protein CKA32_005883 [Geitlerinema sp. FC II]
MDMIFDNIHRQGIKKSEWLKDLDTPGGSLTESIVEIF